MENFSLVRNESALPDEPNSNVTSASNRTQEGLVLQSAPKKETEAGFFKLNHWPPWRRENRKIFIAFGLLVFPILIFTASVLGLSNASCPVPDLCPANINKTTGGSYYYVDFPSTRLIFISSWSSSISFSLIGLLMMLTSYISAREMIKYSTTLQGQDRHLPSPLQIHFLIRLLNGEFLGFLELTQLWISAMFQRQKPPGSTTQKPTFTTIRFATVVFFLGILGSTFIQLADTWLHISTSSVNIIRIWPQSLSSHLYSRELVPCLEYPGPGSICNRNFWGCAMECFLDPVFQWGAARRIDMDDFVFGNSQKDRLLNFTDTNGVKYAILGPVGVHDNIDWEANSFGISTKCDTIPPVCEISVEGGDKLNDKASFNCTKDRAGMDMAGILRNENIMIRYLDFHRYLEEPPPFFISQFRTQEDVERGLHIVYTYAPNISDHQKDDVFRNPWQYVVLASVLSGSSLQDPAVWSIAMAGGTFLMLNCTTTCWNITYTVIESKVKAITAVPSRGSIAGVSSMPLSQMWNQMPEAKSRAVYVASKGRNAAEFVDLFSFEMSHYFVVPLAAHSIKRPSLKAQARESMIVAQVSKTALWTLVSTNLLFVLLGVFLSVLALRAMSEDSHQVQLRLGVAGLTAQLFDEKKIKNSIDNETDLFKGESGVYNTSTRVLVQKTNLHGIIFTTSDVISDSDGDGNFEGEGED